MSLFDGHVRQMDHINNNNNNEKRGKVFFYNNQKILLLVHTYTHTHTQ